MGALLVSWEYGDAYNYNANDMAMTFPMPYGYDTIDAVALYLSKTGSVSGNVEARIYATSGGVPTGGSLGTATIAASSVGSSKGWYTFTFGTPVAVTPGAKYAIVKVDNTDGSNNINWWCSSSASYGDGQGFYYSGSWKDYGRDFSFRVYGYQSAVAPTVTTGSASSILETQFDMAGNVTSDGGATVTERGFVYSSSNSVPTIYDNKKTVTGTTGSYLGTITGVVGGTKYYVRAFATNSQGTGYGSVVQVTTDTNVPTVTTNSMTDLTAVSATGNGNVTSDHGATITQRGFCYKTSSGPTTADSKAICSTNGTGAYTASLTGLSPNTTYYLKAYAINADGTSYGSEVTFTTKDVIQQWCQQFTAAVTGVLTEVQLWLKLVSGTSGTPIIKIYSDNSNSPGTLLQTITITPITNTSYQFIPITTNVSVTATAKYWVVLDTPYVVGSYEVYWGYNTAGGLLLKYKKSSSSSYFTQAGNSAFVVKIQPSMSLNADYDIKYKKKYL